MSKKTESRTRAGIAGVVGAVVAFGIAELVHGLYSSVPSILVSIAQRIVELTPGGLVTAGIELLGKADIPTLIATVLIGTVAIAFFLGNLAVRPGQILRQLDREIPSSQRPQRSQDGMFVDAGGRGADSLIHGIPPIQIIARCLSFVRDAVNVAGGRRSARYVLDVGRKTGI
jgi:hypothetical protein